MSYDLDVPECLLGSLLAVEGVRNSVTILNGPTGCKYYPSSMSEDACSRDVAYNPYIYSNEFFIGQSRIPCTHIDGNDLVMGTGGKVRRIAEIVESLKPDVIGMVNSPGAALIGSKLDIGSNCSIPVVTSESPGYSDTFGKGFQDVIVKLLEVFAKGERHVRPMTVNLIGLSMYQLGWKDSIAELRSLLESCGIKVIAVAGVGWSVEDIAESVNASVNVMLFRNIGDRIAEWYGDNYSMPCVESPCGIPLGFDQTELWIKTVCDVLRCDSAPALKRIGEARARAAAEIKRFNLHTGLPSGCTFSVSGCGPMVYSVVTILHSYLGMIPVAVETSDDSMDAEISRYLSENDIDVADDAFDVPADIFFGSAPMIASLTFRGIVGKGVNTEYPGMKSVQISEEPLLGIDGTMRLLDMTLNALEMTL